ncbi:hypothetical protein ADK60_35910, partial [Streptomyces sp. XY431]
MPRAPAGTVSRPVSSTPAAGRVSSRSAAAAAAAGAGWGSGAAGGGAAGGGGERAAVVGGARRYRGDGPPVDLGGRTVVV